LAMAERVKQGIACPQAKPADYISGFCRCTRYFKFG